MGVDGTWRRSLNFGWLVGAAVVLGSLAPGALFPSAVAASSTASSPGSWAIASTPNVNAASDFELSDVTCVTSSDCWAVGSYSGGTLIEQYTGTSWAVVSSPNPGGYPDSELLGVACISSTDCWAVGSYDTSLSEDTLIEQYDGTGWSVVSSPNPSASMDSSLSGIACAGASDCWAVGSYYNANDDEVTLIEQYTGTGWSIVSSPNPSASTDSSLSGVTCVDSGDCWAVGTAGPPFETLAEHYGGTAWSIVSTANPVDGTPSSLSAVTCVSSDDCWAVGSSTAGSGVLIEQYASDAWSLTSGQAPDGASDFVLSGVTCVSADSCWAVGSYSDGTLVAEFSSSTWTITAPVTVFGASDFNLGGVACDSSGDCWAVGSDATSSAQSSIIEQETGGDWSLTSGPTPPSVPASALGGITCIGGSDCWAVGGGASTAIEHDGGSGWSVVASPDLSGSEGADLSGVACVSASDCWAVGYYTDGSGVDQALIEQYDGSWSVASTPDASGSLSDVTCVNADDCWAVGGDETEGEALVEQYDGTGWSIVTTPDVNDAFLSGVTCVATTECWAVGNFISDTDLFRTLIEQFNGVSWVQVTSPNPSGSGGAYGTLSSVACASASDCWAVGGYYDTNDDGYTITELYDGAGWSLVPSPSPGLTAATLDRPDVPAHGGLQSARLARNQILNGGVPQVGSFLSGVTCVAANDCLAVGDSFQFVFDTTLLEQWNGSSWSAVPTPSPSLVDSSSLAAVTCVSPLQCLSAGGTLTYGADLVYAGELSTLIEQTVAPTPTAYTPLQPFRVCDTRSGNSTACSGQTLTPGGTLDVQVTGVEGGSSQSVPSDAQSVVLNVTAISGSAGTFLSVYPAGFAVPTTSNLNVNPTTNQANLVVVALGMGGQVSIYNSLGYINVAVDVEGYFAAPTVSSSIPGLFHPMSPLRICDTRQGAGTACSGTSADDLLDQNQWTKVVVSGCPTGDPSCTASVPTNGTAAAVALNLTAVNGSASTYLSVVPPSGSDACPTGAPSFSNLNVGAHNNLPNRVIVPLGPEQDVCVYNSLGSINFILDLNGWFGTGAESSQGASFYAVSPLRLCDTRGASSVGYSTECSGGTLTQGGVLTVPVAGMDGLPTTGGGAPPVAIIANVTAVAGSSFTYFTLYPANAGSTPNASDLNVGAQQNTPNLVIVQVATSGGNAGAVDLYNSLGSINAIVDIAGWFQ
jgi:hypothetical protein